MQARSSLDSSHEDGLRLGSYGATTGLAQPGIGVASMRVGLNHFLRFISSSGLSKVNRVLEALQEYLPGKDYYKEVREEAVLAVVSGKCERLRRCVAASDPKKAPHYQACLSGFEQWLAKTKFKVISRPDSQTWGAGEIQISVNPELLLEVDGKRYLVKLYFAKEQLNQPARRAYAWLVGETHGREATAALLDMRKGKLIPVSRPSGRIEQWIRGEVAAFVALWNMNRAA